MSDTTEVQPQQEVVSVAEQEAAEIGPIDQQAVGGDEEEAAAHDEPAQPEEPANPEESLAVEEAEEASAALATETGLQGPSSEARDKVCELTVIKT